MENFAVERLLLLADQHPQQIEQIISLLKEQEKTKQIQIQEQEKTKQIQIQEQEKTKQEQERTKQLQLKLQRSDSTSYSTASQFYNNLSIRKESPDWEKNSNTIITISKNDKIHNEDTLQDALMPIFAEVCKGTTLSAYDIRNTITLPDLKPDVVLIPSVFTLQPPLNPKMQTNWGELCQEGGLVHLIQSVIEIKGIAVNINTSEPKGKILAYLRSILDNQPLKNEAIGALTNGKSIIFFRVKRCEPSGLDYFESDLFPFIDFRLGVASEGLQYLIGMINRICIEIPLPSSTLVLTKYLGKGATSFVYKHSCDEAVKLCSSHNLIYSFIVEGDVLAALNKELPQDLKKHIPNILEHGNCYLKFPLYKPQSTTTSLEKFLPIVDLLEKVHKIGYCHRDIRPENILISTDNNLVLIDWGYSGKKSNEPAFFGTATFCAQEYANKQLGNIDSPYRPEYDFESLFKTIMYLQNESVRTKFAKIRKKGLLFKERLKMALNIWTDTNIPDNITAEIIRDYILNNKFSNDMNLNADY